MERMGATESSEAMRMPLSQMHAVSRRDHVGSPLAFPWPKICSNSTDVFKQHKTIKARKVEFKEIRRYAFRLRSNIVEVQTE